MMGRGDWRDGGTDIRAVNARASAEEVAVPAVSSGIVELGHGIGRGWCSRKVDLKGTAQILLIT